jgi:hypothetical protein
MSDAAGVNVFGPFRREQVLAALCALDYGTPGARLYWDGAMQFHGASSFLLAQTPCLRANVSRSAPQFPFFVGRMLARKAHGNEAARLTYRRVSGGNVVSRIRINGDAPQNVASLPRMRRRFIVPLVIGEGNNRDGQYLHAR